jgi:outer membrane protein assembly factor BamB
MVGAVSTGREPMEGIVSRRRLWAGAACAALVVCAFGSAGTAGAAGAGWEQFGYGAAHTGVNPKEVALDPVSAQKLAPTCAYETGSPVRAPAVVSAGVVYVGDKDGYVTAFSAASCDLVWSKLLSAGSPVMGSLIASGGMVYGSTEDGNMTALRVKTGKRAWQTSTGNQADESPVLAGGRLYVTGGLLCNGIVALDANSGGLIWTTTLTGHLTGPTVGDVAGKTVIFAGSSDGSLYALFADGSAAWDKAADLGHPIEGAPALDVKRGIVAVATDDDAALAQNVLATFDAGTGLLRWSKPLPAADGGTPNIVGPDFVAAAGDQIIEFSAKGKVRWGVTMDAPVNSTLAVANGVIYGSSDAGLLCNGFALDGSNGAELWDASDAATPGPTLASPIVIGGQVVLGYETGIVDVYAPS